MQLTISWPAGVKTFSPSESPVTIGRSLESSVVTSDLAASRQHITLTWLSGAWLAEDRSTHGSYSTSGSKLKQRWQVSDEQGIRLGDPDGQVIQISLQADLATPPSPPATFNLRPEPNPLEAKSTYQADSEDDTDVETTPPHPHGAQSDVPPHPSSTPSDEMLSTSEEKPTPPPAGRPPDAAASPPGAIAQNPGAEPLSQPASDSPARATSYASKAPKAASLPAGQGPVATPTTPPTTTPPTTTPPTTTPPTTVPPTTAPPTTTPPTTAPPTTAPPTTAPPTTAPPTTAPPTTAPPTTVPPGFPARQNPSATGNDHWASDPMATVVIDHSLRLEVDGTHYVFQPNQEVTVGRDPNCSVALNERHSLTSRHHVRITYRDGFWWMEDFSTKGTFVDGRQIENPYKVLGGFKVFLGNKQAGTELKIVAAGEHRSNAKSRRVPILIAAGVALVVVAFAAGAALFMGDDQVATTEATDSPASMEAAFLEQAKSASAMILANSGESVSTGSGFFVSDTLIVTNQHVVDGDDLLEIGVSSGNDKPVEVTYVAEVAELHPFLDIALLRLTGELAPASAATADNRLVTGTFSIEPLSSPTGRLVEVGTSDGVVLGTTVFTTGFPGSFNSVGANDQGGLQLPPVGTDSGNAASYSIWPGCNNPTAESRIPQGSPAGVTCNIEGDVQNAVLTTTFTSGPGASGSPVYQDGKVVAVIFSGTAGTIESNASRSITSSSFIDWLDPLISDN